MFKGKIVALCAVAACAAATSVALAASSVKTATSTHVLASATSTFNKAGTKAKPALYAGSFKYSATSTTGRTQSPDSWSFSWKGVKIDGTDFPKCTSQQIDAAQSDAGCPKGSLFSEASFSAKVGPESDESSNISCTSKKLLLYNAGAGKATFYAVGPASGCAGVGYLPPAPVKVSTVGGTSTVTITFPANLTHPLPGIRSGLDFYAPTFKALKVKKGGASESFMSSTACTGQRQLTFTIKDPEGTHVLTANAGKCG